MIDKLQSDLLDDQVFYSRMAHLHQASARAWLIAALCLLPASVLVLFDKWAWYIGLGAVAAIAMIAGKFIAWRATQFEKSYKVKVPLFDENKS